MAADSAVLRIGRPTRFTLTHARCDLQSTAGLHRFEVVFTRHDIHARAVIDTGIEPFLSFREALTRLYRDLNGEAVLWTHEMDLRLEATVNKLGHVSWTGIVGFGYSGGGDSAQYSFWIDDDQTSLPIILDQLNAIVEEAQGERE
jgi:hypothetical protein